MDAVGQMIDSMPDEQKMVFAQMVQELEMKNNLELMIGSSERCFDLCVNNFRSKKLDENEKKCVKNCIEKTMMTFARSAQRFAEQNNMPTN